ncbi:hypothetical protein [Parageobacillus sp. VR-IP]|uniref:hypothetical protein n=1 Tax=Parageobacillus sp. VR-IP TaxID=2742205 RepID=UPI0020C7F1FB|nr:hypothetical protein [Parageobacillus sp. VR-IP]
MERKVDGIGYEASGAANRFPEDIWRREYAKCAAPAFINRAIAACRSGKKQDARTRKQTTEKRTSANIGRKRHGGNIHPYKEKIDIKG